MIVNSLVYLMVFLPIVGAFVSYLIGRKNKNVRNDTVTVITIVEFILAVMLIANSNGWEGTVISIPEVCGMGLYFTIDGFRVIYAGITAFMWMIASIFSKEYFAHYRNRNRYFFFWLLTLGATIAIFLSADLYTTYIFFEIMSFASYVWVAHDETKPSMRAAATYLGVAVLGGLTLLMGLFLLYTQTGTLQISELYEACQGKNIYPAALCMLVGFGAKAGAFPLQIWLPKAHPVAPAPASALLSGILTKTGIFGILVISCQILLYDTFWGTLILFIGVITMFLGAFLAIFSIDFKRTLACSSVSQIGFILLGIGMQGILGAHNEIAVRGTMLHMVNHSLFKLVLFMVAGVIYMNTHKLDLNDIRGFGRKKPLLKFIYLMGALGIGGVPLWSGYISKTLLHESIVELIHELESGHMQNSFVTLNTVQMIEWIFLISGGLTIAYMTKLYVAVFIEKNQDANVQEKYDAMHNYFVTTSSFTHTVVEDNINSVQVSQIQKTITAGAIGLTICAGLFLLMGIFPYATMDKIAEMGAGFMGISHIEHMVSYFTWTNLKGSVLSIIIGVIVYLCIIRPFFMETVEVSAKAVARKKGSDKGNPQARQYVNRWWKYLDLEDYVYRPLLLQILPAIFGTICLLIDRLVDGIVVVLRKTIYRDSRIYIELDEGNEITYALGRIFNTTEHILNKSLWRKHPKRRDFVHYFAMRYASFKENFGFIERSLSYGLILFCVGLCAVLIYLLASAFG